jgi:hypothetical protein
VFEATEGSFTESEKVQLTKAYADFCETAGVIDVPPWAALSIALATTLIPRAFTVSGKKRVAGFAAKARNLILNREPEL